MWTCACCGKLLPHSAIAWNVVTEEGDDVDVGSDCGKKIRAAGQEGHTHDKTGVTLYTKGAYNALNDAVGVEA